MSEIEIRKIEEIKKNLATKEQIEALKPIQLQTERVKLYILLQRCRWKLKEISAGRIVLNQEEEEIVAKIHQISLEMTENHGLSKCRVVLFFEVFFAL